MGLNDRGAGILLSAILFSELRMAVQFIESRDYVSEPHGHIATEPSGDNDGLLVMKFSMVQSSRLRTLYVFMGM